MKTAIYIISLSLPIMIGCAPVTRTLSPSTNINDLVLMSTKQISSKPVKFEYKSLVSDSIYPLNREGNIINKDFKYYLDLRNIGSKMFKSWIETKYAYISDTAADVITIQINDFTISQYCLDSESKQIAVGLSGGEVTNKVEAKIVAQLQLTNKDKSIINKKITATSEDTYIVSLGKVSPNDYNLTENTSEYKHGKNINNLINKLIILSNAALDQNTSGTDNR